MERSSIGERAYDMALLVRKLSNLKPRIHDCFLGIMAAIPTSICLLLASIFPTGPELEQEVRIFFYGGGGTKPKPKTQHHFMELLLSLVSWLVQAGPLVRGQSTLLRGIYNPALSGLPTPSQEN